MKVLSARDLSAAQLDSLCSRRPQPDDRHQELAVEVFEAVAAQGDQALRDYTAAFDGVELGALEISAEQWEQGAAQVEPATLAALRTAADNIERFHRAQLHEEAEVVVDHGVSCWRVTPAH